ncbi:DUF1501 domain-containing protein [Singulisphaera sp. PoT]|uniref:DUF1501 domain-containing protein n=1 Tax=Singulisphaera sp. PoT TaxID=3411797 RepID=UPI003BF597FC
MSFRDQFQLDERGASPLQVQTRRHFFRDCGVGVGKMALASLMLNNELRAAVTNPLAPRVPHYAPKAKHVIYLFMAGAPSQLDLFDHKPVLQKYDGKPVPADVVKDQRYAFIRPDANLMASPFKFARHGGSGAELSEMLPGLSEVVDDIAIIKSMHTDQFNHAPAQIFVNTGSSLPGRPSMGSWVTYGLGSEAADLPGFVVLSSAAGVSGGSANWGSGFLPTAYQGVPFRSKGDPILNVANPDGVDGKLQRDSLDLIRSLNEKRLHEVGDPEIETRIASYELAYRMQTSAPELMDLSGESRQTLELYGAEPGKSSFANNCLLARRLVERGVRFINLYHEGWDHHSDVAGGLKAQCGQTDRAAAALIKDLKQRGLLNETLVVWGGEFGRTPMVESNANLGRTLGRDHHPQAFTMWLAGGGVKPGVVMGETDDLGFHITKDPVHVHDLQATILHLLGLDHTKLTYKFQGRDFRLTDVHGNLVKSILA